VFLIPHRIKEIELENVFELYNIAEKYKMEDLKKSCSDFISFSFTNENCFNLFLKFKQFSQNEFKIIFYEYLIRNMKQIIKLEGFKNLEKSTLIEIGRLRRIKLKNLKKKNRNYDTIPQFEQSSDSQDDSSSSEEEF
jgi:hypothetical protein